MLILSFDEKNFDEEKGTSQYLTIYDDENFENLLRNLILLSVYGTTSI